MVNVANGLGMRKCVVVDFGNEEWQCPADEA